MWTERSRLWECYKCFLYGNFGHIRDNCSDNPVNQAQTTATGETERQEKANNDEFSDLEFDHTATDTSMKVPESEDPEQEEDQVASQ